MIPSEVVAFFRSTIEANWPHTPVSWPNEQPFDPAGAPYLALTFPVFRETLESFGSPGSSYLAGEGAAHIELLTPLGAGLDDPSAPWQTRLMTLVALLRPKTFANGLGNTFDVASFHEGVEDSYFVRSLAIPYEFQRFG